ncbi:MAG TPA: TetR/AcrR family transcriptional regulator [Candidatus Binatia bacterium]|nr:TetR/AcrR family transcriptional regulator [Candidatus Binatia bacterium]
MTGILRAARELFAGQGYDPTSVAGIAARTGVVEANVYKYFGSKRELLLKVLDDWYDEMFRDYAAALDGVRGCRARVELLVRRHLESVKRHPLLCRLMFREVRSEEDYPGSSLHAQNRRYTRLLVKVLKEGAAAGELRADLPLALLRDMIYGGIEHHAWGYIMAVSHRGRGASLDPAGLAAEITAVLFDGAARRRT